jgi:hypothetical protein
MEPPDNAAAEKLREHVSLVKGVGVGAATAICIGIGSFLLLTSSKTHAMGGVMFYLVPFLAGFSIALVTRGRTAYQAAFLLSLIPSLLLLVVSKREGVLCAFLAFPLLAAALVIGASVGHLFRILVLDRFRHQRGTTALLLALTPLLILAGQRAEQPSLDEVRRETISDSVVIEASPEEVWRNVQSIDRVDVSKPWLMYIGLPIPIRCTLERTGVGAKRTCYFNNGFIQETITEWSPPQLMRLSIDRTNMPGRHWLGFENAVYELRREGSATRLTRTTTITSHLRPVWYWKFFETLGVRSEHKYILRDLAERTARTPMSAAAPAQ